MDELQQAGQAVDLLAHFPVVGFYGLALFANLFPGIPEEVFLLLFGHLTATGELSLPFGLINLFLIFGFLTSDILLYTLSKRGAHVIQKLVRYLSSHYDIDNNPFLRRHIVWVIILSRFLMYMRWIGPVLAGVYKTPMKTFLVADFFALTIYVPVMLLFGRYFSNRIEAVLSGVEVVKNIFGVVIFILLFVAIMVAARRMIKKYFWKDDQ